MADLKFVQAETLPDGWIWNQFNDGSGCLVGLDRKTYANYDLTTNEYRIKGDSWDICRSGLKEMKEIVEIKVRRLFLA